jgi:DNA polymerase III subunit chi
MQVDFYQLSRDPVHMVLPMIAQRVLEAGERLLLVDGREEALDRLSRGLWEGQAASFLAHDRAGSAHAAMQPILLSDACVAENGATHIALADGVWREAALGFARAFYFFDGDSIDLARAAWRSLKALEDVIPRYWRQDGRRWVQGP